MTKFFEFGKLVQTTTLNDDIIASGLGSVLEYVQRLPTPADVRIAMDDAITPAQEATLSGVVAAYVFNVPSGTASQLGSTISAINDLSGFLQIESVNDGLSIEVPTTIVNARGFTNSILEFTSLFTGASGALLEAAGGGGVTDLNGLAGSVNVVGVSGIDVSTSGQNILVGVVFGEAAQHFIDDSEQTTTSTTFQTALSETTTDLPKGTYRIGWSYDFRCDSADRRIETQLTVGGTVVHNPNQDVGHGQDNYYSTGGFTYLTDLEGPIDILFEFRRSGSSGTRRVRNIRIEIWRVKE